MTSQNQLTRTPCAFKFTSKLFEFSLKNAKTFVEEKCFDSLIDNKMKDGFSNFLTCLDMYLNLLDQKISEVDGNVIIFGSVVLENGFIMRANNKYHGKPWFSNVSVRMNSDELFEYNSDQGICYGQVIINY